MKGQISYLPARILARILAEIHQLAVNPKNRPRATSQSIGQLHFLNHTSIFREKKHLKQKENIESV
jgi:hypothetical protein